MDNTQNQNNPQSPYNSPAPQPDYGFLEQYTPPPQKKSKKRPVIIGIIIVMLMIAAVVAVAGSSGNNPASNNKDQATSQSKTNKESGGSLFVEDVLAERYPEAYTRMSVGMKQQFSDQKDFEATVAKPMRQLLTENSCEPVRVAESGRSLVFRCSLNEKDFWAGLGLLDKGSDKELVYTICPLSDKELTTCQ